VDSGVAEGNGAAVSSGAAVAGAVGVAVSDGTEVGSAGSGVLVGRANVSGTSDSRTAGSRCAVISVAAEHAAAIRASKTSSEAARW